MMRQPFTLRPGSPLLSCRLMELCMGWPHPQACSLLWVFQCFTAYTSHTAATST